MQALLKIMALCFSAGCVGGLANSIVVWLGGVLGITVALGVNIAPLLTPGWLYPRIVWGGLWGVLFVFPLMKRAPYLRGLVWSLGPTAVQLLFVFPFVANKGMFGLALGELAPVFVFLFNAVWGLATVAMLGRFGRETVSAG